MDTHYDMYQNVQIAHLQVRIKILKTEDTHCD